MYVSKQGLFLNIILLLQLTPLLGFNGQIACVILLIMYATLHIKEIITWKYPSKYLINAMGIIGLFQILYCKIVYNQSILDGASGIYFIALFLSYYFFYNYITQDYERINILNDKILIIAASVSVLCILQSVLYPHINIFEFSMRNGRMRIPGTAMSFFAEIIGITYLYNGKATTKRKILVSILVFALIFVSQSRGGTILLFCAAVIALIKKLIDSKSKQSMVLLFAFVLGLVALLAILSKTEYWNQIFSFVNEMQEGSGSGATRMNEMKYYFLQLQGNEAMGLGLLRGGSILADKVFRTDLHYFIEDLGLLGFVLQTGVIGCIWVVWAVLAIVRKISKLRKIGKEDTRLIGTVLVMLLVVTLIGFANTNYIIARSTILFFAMVLAQADVLIDRERYLE